MPEAHAPVAKSADSVKKTQKLHFLGKLFSGLNFVCVSDMLTRSCKE